MTNTVFTETSSGASGDRRFEGMNITGATGLSEPQKEILEQLGAVESN